MVTLKFKRTNNASYKANRMIGMFLHNWILDTCGSENVIAVQPGPYDNLFLFQFAYSEDAVVIKLKGAPDSLRKYIELC